MSVLSLASSAPARASEMSEAQAALSEAKNKYFKTIFANPNRTGADEKKLYNQLVVPAEKKLNGAINHSLKASFDKFFGPSIRYAEQRKKQGGVVSLSAADGSAKPPAASKEEKTPPKPDVVLDGSGIPKEVEFKGKPAAKIKGSKPAPRSIPTLKPSVTPVPAETITPAPLPTPSGGVNELEFKKEKTPAH